MIVVRIECCACGLLGGQLWGEGTKARTIRTTLKLAGWRVGARGGVDLCPGCRKKPGLAQRLAEERRRAAK